MIRRGVIYLLWTPVRWLLMLAYMLIVTLKALLFIAILFGLFALGDWLLRVVAR